MLFVTFCTYAKPKSLQGRSPYLTRPAMSTTSRKAGTSFFGLYRSHSQVKRLSGTLTRALFGSMVQNGKFSAGMLHLVSRLKRVLLPTLGRPTMPICASLGLSASCYDTIKPTPHRTLRLLLNLPRIGRSLGSSCFFLGGMRDGPAGIDRQPAMLNVRCNVLDGAPNNLVAMMDGLARTSRHRYYTNIKLYYSRQKLDASNILARC